MVTIVESEEKWLVLLNGTVYTSCDTIEDARAEAKIARRQVRYGL